MMTERVNKALKMLGFEKIPKMSELRIRFLKLCNEEHPDKGGENERFQGQIYKENF